MTEFDLKLPFQYEEKTIRIVDAKITKSLGRAMYFVWEKGKIVRYMGPYDEDVFKLLQENAYVEAKVQLSGIRSIMAFIDLKPGERISGLPKARVKTSAVDEVVLDFGNSQLTVSFLNPTVKMNILENLPEGTIIDVYPIISAKGYVMGIVMNPVEEEEPEMKLSTQPTISTQEETSPEESEQKFNVENVELVEKVITILKELAGSPRSLIESEIEKRIGPQALSVLDDLIKSGKIIERYGLLFLEGPV